MYCALSLNIVYDVRDGYIWGGWCMQTDITELKKAQETLLQAEQKRAAELAKAKDALKRSLDSLTTQPELGAFLQRVVEEAAAQTEAAVAYLFLYDQETHSLSLSVTSEHGADWDAAPDMDIWKRSFPADITPAWDIFVRSKTPFILDLREDDNICWPGTVKWHRRRGHTRAICATLRLGDKPLGFLGLAFTEGATFTNEEVELVQALAQQATLAIQLTHLAEQAKETAVFEERERAAKERAAQLEEKNRLLLARDQLLEAAAACASVLLSDYDFEQAVNTALEILGTSAGADRVGVMEHFDDPSGVTLGWVIQRYEWDSLHTISQIAHPELYRIPYIGMEDYYYELRAGRHLGGLIETFPEPFRSGQEELGVKSTYGIPIFVDGKYWGAIGLDYCQTQQLLGASEIAVLKTAAACIGSAIQRARIRRAQQEAERAVLLEREKVAKERAKELAKINEELKTRDVLLCAVASVTQNLLRSDDFNGAIPDLLAQLGKAAQVSRVALFKEVAAPNDGHLRHEILYEWVDEGIPLQSAIPELKSLANQDYEPWFMNLHAGRSMWGIVDELWEPARQQQATAWVRSTVAVPIFVNGHYWGSVAFDDCKSPRHWLEAELSVLSAAAGSIAAAVERERLVQSLVVERERAANERTAELIKANEALKRSLDSLASQPELEAFLQRVVEEATAQTGAVGGHLFLYDEQTHSLSLSLATDNGGDWRSVPDMEFFKRPIRADSTPTWEILTRSKVPILVDLREDSDLMWPGTFDWHRQRSHTRAIALTLWLGQKPLGVLGLAFAEGATFTAEEVELTQALTQQATLAIELTRLAEEVKQSAVLEERNRIAREIHDTLAQAFTGIGMQLQAATRFLTTKPEQAQSCIARAHTLAHEGLAAARRSVWALQPEAAEYSDLSGALRRITEQITADTSVQAEVCVQGTPRALPPDVGLNLLRIAQEALTNALRYAQAHRIQVTIAYELDRVRLCVQDDGQGFDPQMQMGRGGFGLVGMRQRAEHLGGELTITSQPQGGTEVTVVTPIPEV